MFSALLIFHPFQFSCSIEIIYSMSLSILSSSSVMRRQTWNPNQALALILNNSYTRNESIRHKIQIIFHNKYQMRAFFHPLKMNTNIKIEFRWKYLYIVQFARSQHTHTQCICIRIFCVCVLINFIFKQWHSEEGWKKKPNGKYSTVAQNVRLQQKKSKQISICVSIHKNEISFWYFCSQRHPFSFTSALVLLFRWPLLIALLLFLPIRTLVRPLSPSHCSPSLLLAARSSKSEKVRIEKKLWRARLMAFWY